MRLEPESFSGVDFRLPIFEECGDLFIRIHVCGVVTYGEVLKVPGGMNRGIALDACQTLS